LIATGFGLCGEWFADDRLAVAKDLDAAVADDRDCLRLRCSTSIIGDLVFGYRNVGYEAISPRPRY
jgi:hypothetical protein